MFQILFQTRPTSRAKVDINIEGAFITCWVNQADLNEARQEAAQCIEEEGSLIVEEVGFLDVFPELLDPNSEGYVIYQAAVQEGCIMIFYPWLDQRIRGLDYSVE